MKLDHRKRNRVRFLIWMEERESFKERIQRRAALASRSAYSRRDYGLFINSRAAIAEELEELRDNQNDPVYEYDEVLASIEATFYD